MSRLLAGIKTYIKQILDAAFTPTLTEEKIAKDTDLTSILFGTVL